MTSTQAARHPRPGRVSRRVPVVAYTVEEAAHALRISRSSIYELIRSERLRTVKMGSRRLVPVRAVHDYLDGGSA